MSEYFCHSQPNRLHFLISSFLFHKQNCYIITTNYDNCFEKAYSNISKGDSLESFYIKNMFQAKHHGNKSIFKIHGCAQNDAPYEIVHTTSQESSGLLNSFLEIYKGIFENSTVVFCGYSLSEPDCLEALLEVENYDIIWITTNIELAKENLKIQTLFENANNAFILEDLTPFIDSDWKLINPLISDCVSDNYGKNNLSKDFSELRRIEVKKNGFELYKELIIISDSEKLFRLIIECYLQLRDFTKVQYYLEIYNQLDTKSEFMYSFYNSSIKRDDNSDTNWEEAYDFFQKHFALKI
ncbi:MAG: SIR2 family protein [Ignavibacteria bacterium]|nr:SIR2 family protein [Ignavibacteria bacterium]